MKDLLNVLSRTFICPSTEPSIIIDRNGSDWLEFLCFLFSVCHFKETLLTIIPYLKSCVVYFFVLFLF